jgi:hypothetical protein
MNKRRQLTGAQRQALATAASHPEGRATADGGVMRALSKRGMITVSGVSFLGPLWRITQKGRAAIAAPDDESVTDETARPSVSDLTPEQYFVLRAVSLGDPHTMYPMMRRMLLRKQLIEPADGSGSRSGRSADREYHVTALGAAAIARYSGREPRPGRRSPAIAISMPQGDPNQITAGIDRRRRVK